MRWFTDNIVPPPPSTGGRDSWKWSEQITTSLQWAPFSGYRQGIQQVRKRWSMKTMHWVRCWECLLLLNKTHLLWNNMSGWGMSALGQRWPEEFLIIIDAHSLKIYMLATIYPPLGRIPMYPLWGREWLPLGCWKTSKVNSDTCPGWKPLFENTGFVRCA